MRPFRLALALLVPLAALAAAPPASTGLGDPPLCEASAALIAPWESTLVLVGDNELSDRLFAFEIENGRLVRPRALPLPGGPKDIEALAAIGPRVLVVASHSHDSSGKVKPKRERLVLYERDAQTGALRAVRALDDAHAMETARRSVADCLRTLFVQPPPAHAEQLCRALETLNIEGAATLDDGTWLGLRAPLIDGKAVLLRLAAPLDALRFDRLVLLDLGGRGVRELASHGADLWGIAGPQTDAEGAFDLWRVPRATLGTSAPERMGVLPPHAEGLVVRDREAFVVVDVDRVGGSCRERARQALIKW